LLFLCCLVGAWAIGRATTDRDRTFVAKCLAIAVGLNIAVAIASARAEVPELGIRLYERRAMGLLGNPVHLAALLAATAGYVTWQARGERGWRWALALVGIAVALQLTGSRAGLAVALVIVVVLLARRPQTLVVAAVALALGTALGTVLSPNRGSASTARLASGVSAQGYSSRVQNWVSATSAIAERPLLGWGPGSYGPAVMRHRPLAVAQGEGPDKFFADAHNFVVEIATTTGLMGLIAAASWVALAGIGARGPWVAFVLGAAALHLVQPLSVSTTPLVFLALGMSSSRAPDRRPARAPLVALGTALVGLVLASRLLFGDYETHQAELDFVLSQAMAANNALPEWAAPANLVAKIHAYRAVTRVDANGFALAHDWRVEAARREPWSPQAWIELATFEMARSMPDLAQVHYRRALLENPQSYNARVGLVSTHLVLGPTREDLRLLDEAALRGRSASDARALAALRAQIESRLNP
jgi:O-antigen ligase